MCVLFQVLLYSYSTERNPKQRKEREKEGSEWSIRGFPLKGYWNKVFYRAWCSNISEKARKEFVAQNLKQELITTTNGKIPAIEA